MFVNKLSKKANINLTVYENSHHGFDSEEPIVFNEKDIVLKIVCSDWTRMEMYS